MGLLDILTGKKKSSEPVRPKTSAELEAETKAIEEVRLAQISKNKVAKLAEIQLEQERLQRTVDYRIEYNKAYKEVLPDAVKARAMRDLAGSSKGAGAKRFMGALQQASSYYKVPEFSKVGQESSLSKYRLDTGAPGVSPTKKKTDGVA